MGDVLAIVGSTSFVDASALQQARTIIAGVFDRARPDLVISGAAEGIDTLGVQMARERGIAVREYPPANPRWKPEGYQQRNDLIADGCTRLLRVVCRWSRTYGSGYTRDRAAGQGKLCWSVLLPREITRGVIRLSTPRATLGLGVEAGVVVESAPYARHMGFVGRDAGELIGELVKRRADIAWIPDSDQPVTV